MTDEEFAIIQAREDAFHLPRNVRTQVEKDCTDLIQEVKRLRQVLAISRQVINADSSADAMDLIPDLANEIEAYDRNVGRDPPKTRLEQLDHLFKVSQLIQVVQRIRHAGEYPNAGDLADLAEAVDRYEASVSPRNRVAKDPPEPG